MNTMQIQCFLKAAKCLNFTQSASELFISQPAFSHNISALELEWEVELFDRSKKSKDTRLTPAGAFLYEGMKAMQEQYDDLLYKARNIHQGKSGILRIGLISSDRIDERTLTIFDKFQEKFPGIELSLRRGSHSQLLQWLHDNSLDIAFALKLDVGDISWLAFEPLYSIESVLILTVNHPLAQKDNLSLIDFKNETFLNVSSKESPALNALLKHECEKAGFTPKVLDAPDVDAQILYLESGKGVAIGSVNNTAGFSQRLAMVSLSDLKPLEIVVARNMRNDNPCIALFLSVYEPIE